MTMKMKSRPFHKFELKTVHPNSRRLATVHPAKSAFASSNCQLGQSTLTFVQSESESIHDPARRYQASARSLLCLILVERRSSSPEYLISIHPVLLHRSQHDQIRDEKNEEMKPFESSSDPWYSKPVVI